jgi:hypothetical protein
MLLIVLLTILGGGGALIVGYQWFYVPLADYNAKIRKLDQENKLKDEEVMAIWADKKLLDKARLMSLPPKPDLAVSEYSKYLQPLLTQSGLVLDSFTTPSVAEAKPTTTTPQNAKKPTHQVLAFQVRAKGDLKALVKALERLQKTPLVHRVKALSIDRMDASAGATNNRLNIGMTIEAMIVGRSEGRPNNLLGIDPRMVALDGIAALQGGPTGLALVPWVVGPTGPVAQRRLEGEMAHRYYSDIARRNPFVGASKPPPPREEPDADIEVAEYVRLDTTNVDGREAFLRNLIFKTSPIRIRAVPRSGYDTFRVMNENRSKTILRGKVLRIDQRDVYFQVKEDIYGIHIGQTLADAMRRPLNNGELEDLELSKLYDEDWAAEDDTPAKSSRSRGKMSKGGKGKFGR